MFFPGVKMVWTNKIICFKNNCNFEKLAAIERYPHLNPCYQWTALISAAILLILNLEGVFANAIQLVLVKLLHWYHDRHNRIITSEKLTWPFILSRYLMGYLMAICRANFCAGGHRATNLVLKISLMAITFYKAPICFWCCC